MTQAANTQVEPAEAPGQPTASEQDTQHLTAPEGSPAPVIRVVLAANACLSAAKCVPSDDQQELTRLKKRCDRQRKDIGKAWAELAGQINDRPEWADALHDSEQLLQDLADNCESYIIALQPNNGPSLADLDAILDEVINMGITQAQEEQAAQPA